MSAHTIRIQNGRLQFVYDDALADLMVEVGRGSVCRASHVEPHPSKAGWLADMTPSGGPVLGVDGAFSIVELLGDHAQHYQFHDGVRSLEPFKTRAEALAAERKWLTREKGL